MKQKNYFQIFSSVFVCIVIFLSMSFSAYATQSAVNLGTAGDFVILSKSGVSTTGTTSITGDIGVSPIDSTAITGFGLIMDSSNEFATSSLVTGKLYAADYTVPTPSKMTTAVSDMQTAYTDVAGRTLPDYTELGAGNIGGMTLTQGLYKWGTGVTIPTDVTLSGSSTDVWIFQIAQDLDISSATHVILSGGALAKNIFWQVAGQTTLGTTSVFNGNILGQTEIVFGTGATLNGRALAQTAVTLDANTVSLPLSTTTSLDSDKNSDIDNSAGASLDIGGSSSGTSSSQNSNQDSSNDASNGNSISNIIKTQVSGNTDSVTKPKGIVNIVAGVSTTVTNNGNKIELTSDDKGRTKLKSGDVNVETELTVEVEGDIIRVTKSNGVKSEIKVMPSVASETAIARLTLKFCTEANNCTIVLKEVGTGSETKVEYSVKAHKDVKILGLFRAKMNVEANVDAGTNEVISTKIPWWNSISTDVD